MALAIIWLSTGTVQDLRKGTLIIALMVGVVMRWLDFLERRVEKLGDIPA
ncbi:MAG: hypothetical protein FWG82_01025 [Oscillospiraceae bacterium]|nr:hypothetical protein [Oscillospiraceae bacterium]